MRAVTLDVGHHGIVMELDGVENNPEAFQAAVTEALAGIRIGRGQTHFSTQATTNPDGTLTIQVRARVDTAADTEGTAQGMADGVKAHLGGKMQVQQKSRTRKTGPWRSQRDRMRQTMDEFAAQQKADKQGQEKNKAPKG